jgi:hypothetical protein
MAVAKIAVAFIRSGLAQAFNTDGAAFFHTRLYRYGGTSHKAEE